MKHLFTLLLLLLAPLAAKATEYGPFFCTDCRFSGLPIGSPPTGEIHAFITNVVNHYDSGYYAMGDTVVICNGAGCGIYRRAMTTFVLDHISDDPGPPYLNATPVGSVGGGGSSGTGGIIGFGVVGFRPIYMTGYVTVNGITYAQQVLVGWEPIYGQYTQRER